MILGFDLKNKALNNVNEYRRNIQKTCYIIIKD